MDGSTSSEHRQRQIHQFNDTDNMQARLFLISTKGTSLIYISVSISISNFMSYFDHVGLFAFGEITTFNGYS